MKSTTSRRKPPVGAPWNCWSISALPIAPATFRTPFLAASQQRIAVARALANRPNLILADEPTAALDSRRGRQVMELFHKVAHDQRALDAFDRILERMFQTSDGASSDFE